MKLLLFASERPWARGVLEALRARGHELERRPPGALTDMRRTRAELAALRPEAAVMLDGFAAEADPALSFSFNTEAPVNLAMAALEFRAVPVLRVPSAVAAGARPSPVESEPLPGADDFSDSLLRGERFLLRAAPHALILRAGPILNREAAQARLQEGVLASPTRALSPVSSEQLAEALSRALALGLSGRLHLGSSPCSELALWRELQQVLGGSVREAAEAQRGGPQALSSERGQDLGELGSWREALLGAPRPEGDQPQEDLTHAELDNPAAAVEQLAGACAAVLRVRTEAQATQRAHPQPWRLLLLEGKVWVEGAEDQILRPGELSRLPAEAAVTVHTSGAACWLELLDADYSGFLLT